MTGKKQPSAATLTEQPSREGRVLNFGANFNEAYNKLQLDIAAVTGDLAKGTKAAEALKQVAIDVCKNLDPTRPGSDVTLLFGMIQSGKTGALTQALSLAADNGYRVFVVLTMDNEALYTQTATRLRESLQLMQFFRKSDIKPKKLAHAKQALVEEKEGTGPGTVIFLSKNSMILGHALELFKKAGIGDVPTVIFDDEADQASLNGKQWKLDEDKDSQKKAKEQTEVHRIITKMRAYFTQNAYVAVTATPQALFLQDEGALHKPKYHVVIPQGDGYQGGDYFLEDRPHQTCRVVGETEVADYLKPPKVVAKPNIPHGMRKAVASFFVGASMGIAHDADQQKPRNKYSMLIHISARQKDHERIVSGVIKYAKELKSELEAGKIPDEVQEAYQDIAETTTASGRVVPDLPTVTKLIMNFGPVGQIIAVNAQNSMDFTKLENYRIFNIFVGGNVLGRGITIHGLITTYYGRNSPTPQLDTVMQHARWYGYRRKLEPYIRVFVPKAVWDRFMQLHYHDMELRQAALRYLEEKQPIVPLLVPKNLKPTRANVLEPGSLGTYAGGQVVPQRLPHVLKSCYNTEAIEEILAKHTLRETEGRKVGFVSLDEARTILTLLPTSPGQRMGTWHNETVDASLQALCSVLGHKKVRVVVAGPLTRGRSKATPFPYHINSFIASGSETTKSIDERIVDDAANYDPPGETCDAPTLYLFKVKKDSKGEQGVGWGDPMDPDGSEADMKGKEAPRDFYVAGFHPPEFIKRKDGQRMGYGIVFTLP